MKIAVDAMGGDDAPHSVVQGVKLLLTEDSETSIILIGKKELIDKELHLAGLDNHNQLSVYHTDEFIDMGESPVKALRTKKKASISIMMDLAKKGEVDAVFSAGNTGALVASATLKLRTLEGIDRPGLATVMPTPYGNNLLLDVGAVTDAKPRNLLQFGVMGSLISHSILDIKNPSVGLLNVGEEDSKGNELTKEAFNLLSNSTINFVGNVEGRDIFKDTVNVIVTDGFVGNVVLKASESLASGLFSVVKKEITANPLRKIWALMLKKAFRNIKERFNHEEYGGALLLGVKKITIAAHGSSSPLAIKNALKLAIKMVKIDINDQIIKLMEKQNG